jgi:hypothetical protein
MRSSRFRGAGRLLRQVFLEQPQASSQLSLARIVTALSALETVRQMPPGRVLEQLREPDSEQRADSRPRLRMSRRGYETSRVVAAVSLALWGAGVRSLPVTACANISFGLAQKHVVDFHKKAWNYNSHLNAFLALLSVVGEKGRRPGGTQAASTADSAALAVLQLYYATMYFQSGLAKLRVGGPGWADGRTLRAGMAEHGNAIGRRISKAPQPVLAACASGALAFELLFPLALLLLWDKKAVLGLTSVGFHGVIKATMGISFWHHSVFALPLFAGPETLRRLPEGLRKHLGAL